MKSVQNYRTTILTAILILFTNNFTVLGQINGKIDGEISESGIFIKDITLSYSPENTDIDIYSLNLEKFQFGFSDLKVKNRKDNNNSQSQLEFTGPELLLKNLTLHADLFKSDWITEEKLKRMYKRESLPKKAIEELNNAIELYNTDQDIFPKNTDDLIIKNYIDITKSPFNNSSWIYVLDLPNTITAKPSHTNPIPNTNSIVYDFNSKEFKIDQRIDSLKSVPLLQWIYTFEIKEINATSSTSLDIQFNNSNSNFSMVMESGKFKINHIKFTANPERQLNNKSIISLPELLIESKNLIIDGHYDSLFTFHKGEGQFRIRNFSLKIPDGLGKEPEIESLLSQIGVWNNSINIRLIDINIQMINQFTGNISLVFNTPFIKASIQGDISFRQQSNQIPEFRFHNTELIAHPIALGLKKWIRDWEKRERKTLTRKGPAIIIKFNGPINSFNPQSLKDIAIF